MATHEPSDETRGQDMQEEDVEHHQAEKKRKQESNEKTAETQKLGLKDWLALIIAALQTVLLPVIVLLGLIFILTIIISVLL